MNIRPLIYTFLAFALLSLALRVAWNAADGSRVFLDHFLDEPPAVDPADQEEHDRLVAECKELKVKWDAARDADDWPEMRKCAAEVDKNYLRLCEINRRLKPARP